MPITVQELLELPHLALELVAGSDGADRPIRWAHVSEVEDPTPWLEGDELILTTGLGLPHEAEGQITYVRRLADVGAVGVVLVADSAPPLAAGLAAVADDLAFPLITTYLKQPFQAISKVVYAANATAEVESVIRHLRIYGVLRAAAAQGARPADLLERLARLTGMRLAVVREDGRPQFEPGAPHARWPEAARALAELGGSATRGLYARLAGAEDSAGAYVIQLETPPQARVFLIAEGLRATGVPDLVAAHHIATIMATQVLAQRTERALRQRLGTELLSEILDATLSTEAARGRLRALSLPTSGLAAFVARPAPRETVVLVEAIHDVLADHDVRALVGAAEGEIVVLGPAGTARDSVARLLRTTVTATTGGQVGVGIGTAGAVAHMQTSYREGRVAAAYAEASASGVSAFGDLDRSLTWLAPDRARLALTAERTVGPLLRYDHEHGTELVRTLREFLRANRKPANAARLLHVHRNTLAYRLRRIESLTGRSLESIDDQVELWVGLRAHELAAISPH
jgi:purine catabolism regulator